MTQCGIPAVFMRGGTSKGVFFHADDLPAERAQWDPIFLAAIGSPDAYGRQLNGLGGGISSLSKAVVVGPSSVDDADVDYTFGQVAVDAPVVDYSTTCGNLSSAIGPYAVDAGLVAATGAETLVRVHITNTGKRYHARLATVDGRFQEAGDFVIPGVTGGGSRIRLDFLDPGGATTGELLPSGQALDVIQVPSDGDYEVSMVDASTACVFVAAERFGLTGVETVAEFEADVELMTRLERLRRAAAVRMGLAGSEADAALANPKIGLVAPSATYRTLAGEEVAPADADVTARILSMGQVHRVLPLTGAMCLAVACRIPGSVAERVCAAADGDIRLANPSGVLPVDSTVSIVGNRPRAETVTVYRTARAMMEGRVLVPD